jgi:hypothetical protein
MKTSAAREKEKERKYAFQKKRRKVTNEKEEATPSISSSSATSLVGCGRERPTTGHCRAQATIEDGKLHAGWPWWTMGRQQEQRCHIG